VEFSPSSIFVFSFGRWGSREVLVSMVTIPGSERQKNHGSIPGSSKKFFFLSKNPEWFWSPNSLIYKSSLLGSKAAGA
jgi:hypothetical protein